MDRKTYTIDVTGRILGRLATQIANLLRGKRKPSFVRDKDMGDFVVIKNVDKISFTGKKLLQKKYRHHTEYLGGYKEITLRKLFEKDPRKVLRKAVWGMLPKNSLRKDQIKRLKIM